MVTAFSQGDTLHDAGLAAGAISGVLVKPVSAAALRVVLTDAVEPRGALPGASHGGGPAMPELAALRGRRALLVEDNEINQELAHELLSNAGLVVDVANDGREALAMIEPGRYDLVLMDCQMPVLDGYEATAELRRDPRLAALPIIAMTANAMKRDVEHALAVGMNDHIAKPIDIAAMFAVLLRWVGR